MEADFSSTRTYCSASPSFRLVKTVNSLLETVFFYSTFFSANRKYYWNLQKVKFSRRTIFILAEPKLFRLFQIFFKVEAELLPYSGSVFFNVLYPVNANRFSANVNSIFLVRAIFLLLEIISVIKSSSFFRLLERSISMKSFIPASRNEFCVYWKQYCFILSFFC